jgi:hypothetical protein
LQIHDISLKANNRKTKYDIYEVSHLLNKHGTGFTNIAEKAV